MKELKRLLRYLDGTRSASHRGNVWLMRPAAPAGGAAAEAPERGALAGPSAPTSTSTRWALVTPYPC
jgi:hypothetical protein